MWQEVGHYLKDELTLCGNKEVKANGRDQTWLNSSCKGCEAVTTTLRVGIHNFNSGGYNFMSCLLELSMEVRKPKSASPVVSLILLEDLQ